VDRATLTQQKKGKRTENAGVNNCVDIWITLRVGEVKCGEEGEGEGRGWGE